MTTDNSKTSDARLALLAKLRAEGASDDEIAAAAREGRLALLPLERSLTGAGGLSPREISERSGVELELLRDQWRAMGIVPVDDDDPVLSSMDLDAAHRLKVFIDAGIPPASITQMARVMAMAMSQFAAANRELLRPILAEFAGEMDYEADEDAIAFGLREIAETMLPLVGPTLEYVYRQQLSQQIHHIVFDLDTLGTPETEETEVAIAFVDMVGFTKLGERLPADELGAITGRLEEMVAEVAHAPVRLVKLIGDAAMLSAPSEKDLVDAVLDLLDLAAAEGDSFPGLRAGVSTGPVVSRGGDFFGRTVNLASRVTGVARPSSVLVTDEVKQGLGDGYDLSFAGAKRLKGIDGSVPLHRCRRSEPAADAFP